MWFMPELIGYARVASRRESPKPQHEQLRAAGCTRLFTDFTRGALRDRPQLAAAVAYVKSGDALVVPLVATIGTSLVAVVDLLSTLIGDGVRFWSLGDNIDTGTPVLTGAFLAHMLGVLAHLNARLVPERTAPGLEVMRSRGRPVEVTEQQVSRARVMIAEGVTVRETARQVGVSRGTLYAHIDPVQLRRLRGGEVA